MKCINNKNPLYDALQRSLAGAVMIVAATVVVTSVSSPAGSQGYRAITGDEEPKSQRSSQPRMPAPAATFATPRGVQDPFVQAKEHYKNAVGLVLVTGAGRQFPGGTVWATIR